MRKAAKLGLGMLPLVLAMVSGTNGPRPYPLPTPRFFPEMPLPEGYRITEEGVALGRMLFHDPLLGRDSAMACAGCHRQEHAFADTNTAFSTGVVGLRGTRNTPPLFNLAWYPAFFWDGRARTLEEQMLHPVRDPNELGADWPTVEARIRRSTRYPELFRAAFGTEHVDSLLVARAIGQFLRTLISADSKYDRVLAGRDRFTADEAAGFVLANEQHKGDCLQCHTTDRDALGTNREFSNNGLDPASDPLEYKDPGLGGITGRPADMGRFKVPSLRNVAVTPPYMHDGRFATLEEVIDHYSDGVHAGVNTDPRMGNAGRGGARLGPAEKQQLLAFLLTLTDSTFLTDRRHADPFRAR